MSFDSHTTPKAAKPYKCEECFGVIPKGEPYHYLSGLHDGEFYTAKMCGDCFPMYDEANNRAWKNGDEGIPLKGGLFEDIVESEDPARLEKYIAIRVKRGAKPVSEWVTAKLARLRSLPSN